MNDNRNQFEIAFDTKKYPGSIEAVQVHLQNVVMNKNDVANLALCEHPLYPQLQEYCRNNSYRPPCGKVRGHD